MFDRAQTDVARVNPRQAREFVESMGVLANTGRVDARCLRHFADVLARYKDRHKYITLPADAEREVLTALMTRSRDRGDACGRVQPTGGRYGTHRCAASAA